MKRQLNNIGIFLAAFFVIGMQDISAQCDSWEKHPQGKEEAQKLHVLYRDKIKEKNGNNNCNRYKRLSIRIREKRICD